MTACTPRLGVLTLATGVTITVVWSCRVSAGEPCTIGDPGNENSASPSRSRTLGLADASALGVRDGCTASLGRGFRVGPGFNDCLYPAAVNPVSTGATLAGPRFFRSLASLKRASSNASSSSAMRSRSAWWGDVAHARKRSPPTDTSAKRGPSANATPPAPPPTTLRAQSHLYFQVVRVVQAQGHVPEVPFLLEPYHRPVRLVHPEVGGGIATREGYGSHNA